MKPESDNPGDPDLYVKFDGLAATADYDCRPYLDGAAENCVVDAPGNTQGAHVMVHGYEDGAFSVTVTYSPRL